MSTAFSFALVGFVRMWAVRSQLLDIPNNRSSHSTPTPRGGGLAVVVTFLLSVTFLTLSGQLPLNVSIAFIGGGGLVAAIGYQDDRRGLPAKNRLFGYLLAAIWATGWTGGIPRLNLGFVTWEWGWVGYLVSILAIMWMLNLFNFMDGIDGIAASEAGFAAGAGGIFLLAAGTTGLALTALALAAACIGFLFWNWPPAKIFLGDVGSVFLGYVLAVLAIVSDQQTNVPVWIWLLLLSVFIVDATVTLLRRLVRRTKVFQAHRCHAYQHATTLLGSHLKVTTSVIAINCFGLFPLAVITLNWPATALLTTGVAVIGLSILALYFRAGIDIQSETGRSIQRALK